MNPEIVQKLSEARDFYSLTKAVLSMCEPYGPIHAFRLIHNRGSARVACLIELESTKQQPALARALGGKVLNGAACLEIPVDRSFGGAAKGGHASVVAIAPQPAFEARVAQS